MPRLISTAIVGLLLMASPALAATCSPYTYNFSSGTTADAAQVNNNFSNILTCANTLLAPLASPAFTGNVGIGTTTPGSSLDIAPASGNAIADINRPDTSHVAAITLRIAGTMDWEMGMDPALGSAGDLAFYNTGTSTANLLIQRSSGNVGIGTTAPAATLTVVGDIRTGNSGSNGCVQNFAGTALTGTCSSDAALKNVVSDVSGVLDRFGNLQLVKFHWNRLAENTYHSSPTVLNTGFIAQAVEVQFPELVTTDSKGYRQLDYSTLSLYGLEAVKELKSLADRQAKEISELESRLAAENRRVSQLEARVRIQSAANGSIKGASIER